jgi:3-dehydroquinate synthase
MRERVIGGVTSVRIGRDVLNEVADGSESMITVLAQPGAGSIADRIVADLESRSIPALLRMLPDGESAKTLAVVEETARWMSEVGLKRDGVVLGVGGGALTDLAGFAASVYMRGVEARYAPTTLLGAIDASIGGKTAVNVGGKNLVGTFVHPTRVVIDVAVLEGLAEDLLAEGMAEALKAGLIGDPELLAILEVAGLDADLQEVVTRAIEVKASVVEQDFRESGQRLHLNFGHTIGHAIETVAGWSHGRSVAVGMVAAAAISRQVHGFEEAERVTSAVAALGLPVTCSGPSRDELHRLMRFDKKGTSGSARMVLLEEVGRPRVSDVDSATLDFGLDAIGIGEQ